MRIKRHGNTVRLWANARDTRDWATRPGMAWPCSTLAGKRLYAELESGDLIDLSINGSDRFAEDQDVDGHELTAFLDDCTN